MHDITGLVFVAAKKTVSALDSHTGRVVWTTTIPGKGWFSTGFATITVDPLALYACRSGTITCIDPSNGAIQWSVRPPHAGSALPVAVTLLSNSGHDQGQTMAAAQANQQAAAAGASGATGAAAASAAG